MVRRAAVEIRQLHFNHDNDFLYVKKDKLTGQDTIQTNSNVQKTKDLKSMVSHVNKKSSILTILLAGTYCSLK